MSRSTIQHERDHGPQAVAGRPVARRFGLKTALATTVVVAGLGLAALPAFAGYRGVVSPGPTSSCVFKGKGYAAGEKITGKLSTGQEVTLTCLVDGRFGMENGGHPTEVDEMEQAQFESEAGL